jgi:PAP_fibrillin
VLHNLHLCTSIQLVTLVRPVPQADKLSGEWKLVYTSGSELSALLALSKLPFVTVGDITQTIDGAAGTVINKVQLGKPAAPGHARL